MNRNKPFGKAVALFRVVFVVLVTFILGLNMYLLVARVVFKEELPRVLGLAQVVVVSGSMEPAIETGDVILIRRQADYYVGDVITYRSRGVLVTHRVVAVEGASFVTQGDANNVADAPVPINQVEGKVMYRIPRLGLAVVFIRTPVGIGLMAVGGIVLILTSRGRGESK